MDVKVVSDLGRWRCDDSVVTAVAGPWTGRLNTHEFDLYTET